VFRRAANGGFQCGQTARRREDHRAPSLPFWDKAANAERIYAARRIGSARISIQRKLQVLF